MLSRLEIRWLNIYSKPKWRRTVYISVYVEGLLNLHVDTIANWVEVKHDRLLFEPETLMCLIHHRVYVFVNRLFNVDLMTCNFHHMTLDVCQCHETFLKL